MQKFFSNFLIYKIFAFIQSVITYIKDYRLISDTLYSRQFNMVIMKYLKCELDKDWIGRLYGIINPNLDINGRIDVSSVILEIDDYQTNNEEYVKNWIYRQMGLISSLFKIERLYDYISLDIKHVGPENHDNYLLVIDITSRRYMAYNFKRMFWHAFIYGIILAGILIFI